MFIYSNIYILLYNYCNPKNDFVFLHMNYIEYTITYGKWKRHGHIHHGY